MQILCFQAIADGIAWKSGIMFFSGKSFLLCGRR